jgi:thiamine pyrophosphokinase
MLAHPLEAGHAFTALVMNYHLPPFFPPLWDRAETRICADGGANRLFDALSGQSYKTPDLVVGDFDSLRPSVRSLFERSDTKFDSVFDQDRNDLDKCLHPLTNNSIKTPVLVFGGFGGRFDQTTASLNVSLRHPEHRIFFLDENNFTTWIFPHDKGIICPQQWTTKVCGLLPLVRRVRKVTTKGLKWDCDFGLEMGKLISSSNEIAEGVDRVLITTTDPLVWTNQTKSLKELPL